MGFDEYQQGDDQFYIVTGYATMAASGDVHTHNRMQMPYDLWADSGEIIMYSITGGTEMVYTGVVNIDVYNPQYAESVYSGNDLITKFTKWDVFVSGYLPSGVLNAVNAETTGGIDSNEDLRTLLRRHVGKVYMHYGIDQISHRRGIWVTSGLVSG